MDGIQILLLVAAVLGIFLMVFSLIRFGKDDKKPESTSYYEMDNNIKAINSSLDEAEKAVEELNKFAESVLSDIDDKHQELLFIYNLIDEKKNEVMRLYGNYDVPKTAEVEQTARKKPSKASKDPKMSINPRNNEIIGMFENGMSVSEISKALDIGQGEVKLILELSRAR